MNLRELDGIITGEWTIFLRRKNALNYFNISSSNFFWSFSIIFLVLVFQAYTLPIEMQIFNTSLAENDELIRINYLFQAATLIVNWFLWPVIAYLICKLMGLTQNYIRYVIIDNYSAIVTMTIGVLPSFLYQLSLPTSMVNLLIFISFFVLLLYKWRVIKTALNTNGVNASLLLFIDFSTTIIISYAAKYAFTA